MVSDVGRRLVVAASVLGSVPGVAAAQPLSPTVVTDLSGPVRALGSFALVLLFGGALLVRYGEFVDESLDALIDSPYAAVPYGLMAYGVVVLVGLYGISQLGRVGVANTVLGQLGVVAILTVVVVLTALGFLVVGTLLTDLSGRRRPTRGLVLGAVLSAVGWVALPFAGGLAIWVVVAAFGIGGTTRRWFHAERTVETERQG